MVQQMDKNLFEAIKKGKVADVQKYLDLGADVNISNATNNGGTALHYAAKHGMEKIVNMSLHHGANIEARDSFEWTALHYATEYGHDELIPVLLGHGANIDAKDKDNMTSLLLACDRGFEKIVVILLENNANMEVKTKEDWTALHYAACNGYENIVKILLARGADANAVTKSNKTALHYAAERGQDRMVSTLLEAGIIFDIKDRSGKTALDYAIEKNYITVAKLLQSRGAQSDAKPSSNAADSFNTPQKQIKRNIPRLTSFTKTSQANRSAFSPATTPTAASSSSGTSTIKSMVSSAIASTIKKTMSSKKSSSNMDGFVDTVVNTVVDNVQFPPEAEYLEYIKEYHDEVEQVHQLLSTSHDHTTKIPTRTHSSLRRSDRIAAEVFPQYSTLFSTTDREERHNFLTDLTVKPYYLMLEKCWTAVFLLSKIMAKKNSMVGDNKVLNKVSTIAEIAQLLPPISFLKLHPQFSALLQHIFAVAAIVKELSQNQTTVVLSELFQNLLIMNPVGSGYFGGFFAEKLARVFTAHFQPNLTQTVSIVQTPAKKSALKAFQSRFKDNFNVFKATPSKTTLSGLVKSLASSINNKQSHDDEVLTMFSDDEWLALEHFAIGLQFIVSLSIDSITKLLAAENTNGGKINVMVDNILRQVKEKSSMRKPSNLSTLRHGNSSQIIPSTPTTPVPVTPAAVSTPVRRIDALKSMYETPKTTSKATTETVTDTAAKMSINTATRNSSTPLGKANTVSAPAAVPAPVKKEISSIPAIAASTTNVDSVIQTEKNKSQDEKIQLLEKAFAEFSLNTNSSLQSLADQIHALRTENETLRQQLAEERTRNESHRDQFLQLQGEVAAVGVNNKQHASPADIQTMRQDISMLKENFSRTNDALREAVVGIAQLKDFVHQMTVKVEQDSKPSGDDAEQRRKDFAKDLKKYNEEVESIKSTVHETSMKMVVFERKFEEMDEKFQDNQKHGRQPTVGSGRTSTDLEAWKRAVKEQLRVELLEELKVAGNPGI